MPAHALTIRTETIAMLDHFGCDVEGFIVARIKSHEKVNGRLPVYLRFIDDMGETAKMTPRLAELHRAFAEGLRMAV